LSKNGIGIMNAYPGPTPGCLARAQNWLAQANQPIDQRKEAIDINLNPSAKHHIAGRRNPASYFEYQSFDQGSGETGQYFTSPNQTNTVSWVYTISPILVNEARATFSLDDVYIPVNTGPSGFNQSSFGTNYPYIFSGKDLSGKTPTVTIMCRSLVASFFTTALAFGSIPGSYCMYTAELRDPIVRTQSLKIKSNSRSNYGRVWDCGRGPREFPPASRQSAGAG
jgi:hypothetical protein